MGEQELRGMTVSLIHDFCRILDYRAVTYSVPPDSSLADMELWEIRSILRDLAILALDSSQ